MAETMKLAYADRSEYLGDPDFTKVPVKGLTSRAYADELAKKINPDRATPSTEIKPGQPQPYESDQTTHYSVADKDGNLVATTYTLNLNFGSGIVATGTGITLNNEMDDFAAKPGVPNAFGLIGGDANAVGPTSVRCRRCRRPSCSRMASPSWSPAARVAAASSPPPCRPSST
jgi:gamma-glutamyltranspeptidase/glutathione hydrolase